MRKVALSHYFWLIYCSEKTNHCWKLQEYPYKSNNSLTAKLCQFCATVIIMCMRYIATVESIEKLSLPVNVFHELSCSPVFSFVFCEQIYLLRIFLNEINVIYFFAHGLVTDTRKLVYMALFLFNPSCMQHFFSVWTHCNIVSCCCKRNLLLSTILVILSEHCI